MLGPWMGGAPASTAGSWLVLAAPWKKGSTTIGAPASSILHWLRWNYGAGAAVCATFGLQPIHCPEMEASLYIQRDTRGETVILRIFSHFTLPRQSWLVWSRHLETNHNHNHNQTKPNQTKPHQQWKQLTAAQRPLMCSHSCPLALGDRLVENAEEKASLKLPCYSHNYVRLVVSTMRLASPAPELKLPA
jgi:hypothetical protein